jgi:hypothetical protein
LGDRPTTRRRYDSQPARQGTDTRRTGTRPLRVRPLPSSRAPAREWPRIRPRRWADARSSTVERHVFARFPHSRMEGIARPAVSVCSLMCRSPTRRDTVCALRTILQEAKDGEPIVRSPPRPRGASWKEVLTTRRAPHRTGARPVLPIGTDPFASVAGRSTARFFSRWRPQGSARERRERYSGDTFPLRGSYRSRKWLRKTIRSEARTVAGSALLFCLDLR